MPFLSVIVPIYNMEMFIEKFLNSILNQEFKDFEVLLVDDGSTDQSLKICMNYSKIDSRFMILKKNNGGVASARQLGLENSIGEYIIHADPDDYLPFDAFKLMVNNIKKTNCDICVGSYNIVFPNKQILIVNSEILDSNDFIKKLAFDKIHGALWNKMIRASLCKNIDFDKNINYMEDKIFLLKVLKENLNAQISVIENNVYCYRQRLGSYTNEINNKSVEKFQNSSQIIQKMLGNYLTLEEIKKIQDIVKIQIELQKKTNDIKIGFFWLKIFIHDNFKWHLKMIALFLIIGIKYPLIFYRNYLEIKRKKNGIY